MKAYERSRSSCSTFKKMAEILEKELERKQIFSHYNLTFKCSEKVTLYPVYFTK